MHRICVSLQDCEGSSTSQVRAKGSSSNQIEEAIKTYTEIEEKYYESFEFAAARKHKARLEGLAAK